MNYVALERHYFLVAFINFLILQIMKLSNVRTLPLRRWEYAMTRQHRGGYHIGFRSGEFYSPYWRSRDDASFGGNIVATGTRNIPEYFVTGGYGLRRNASSMVGPQRTDLRKWRSLDSESRPIDGHTNASGTESGWRSRGQCGGAAGTPALWRVMSFNILADSLVDQKYDILDPSILPWPERKRAIFQEIEKHLPSICCLQEVDCFHLKEFEGHLGNLGYAGLFKQNTSGRHDGVAVFWRKSEFSLETSESVELKSMSSSFPARGQVALLVMLRETGETRAGDPAAATGLGSEALFPPRFAVVANTHLIFSPTRGDIKLGQLMLLVQAVQRLRLRALLRAYTEVTSWNGNKQFASTSADDVLWKGDVSSPYRTSDCASGGRREAMLFEGESPRMPTQDAYISSLRESLLFWNGSGVLTRGQVQGMDSEALVSANNLVHAILCGDFNFTPQSPLYRLLTSGEVDFRDIRPKYISCQHLMQKHIYPVDDTGYCGRGATKLNTPAVLDISADGVLSRRWQDVLRAELPACFLPAGGSPLSAPDTACLERREEDTTTDFEPTLSPSGIQSDQTHCCDEVGEEVGEVGGTVGHVDGLQGNSQDLPVASTSRDAPLNSVSNSPYPPPSEAPPFLVRLPFALASAYAIRGRNSQHSPNSTAKTGTSDGEEFEEPAYTAYFGWQKGCIDFIFYLPTNLQVNGVYEMPSVEDLRRHSNCPSKLWPSSDHFSLVADFTPKPLLFPKKK